MYTFAIVDDEQSCIDDLKDKISTYFSQNKGEFDVVEFHDGKELLKDYKPRFDVIFLDIEMNDVDGMRAAEEIRRKDQRTAIIFITRLSGYAISGYAVSALDFIVKPLSYERFAPKLARALAYADRNRVKNIVVGSGDNMRYIDPMEIRYVEVQNHKVGYVLANERIEVWGTLKEVEGQLSDLGFCECNRCYLVNLRFVKGIDGNMVKVGDEKLLISRYKKKELLVSLAKFYGKVI